MLVETIEQRQIDHDRRQKQLITFCTVEKGMVKRTIVSPFLPRFGIVGNIRGINVKRLIVGEVCSDTLTIPANGEIMVEKTLYVIEQNPGDPLLPLLGAKPHPQGMQEGEWSLHYRGPLSEIPQCVFSA